MVRAGVPNTFPAMISDPGSDDLTLEWNYGDTHIYYNNGETPDPPLSPWGTFPFELDASAELTFWKPGLHRLKLELSDDDGGQDSAELRVIAIGPNACKSLDKFWTLLKKMLLKRKHSGVDLQYYLQLAEYYANQFAGEWSPEILRDLAGNGELPPDVLAAYGQLEALNEWLHGARAAKLLAFWQELELDERTPESEAFHELMQTLFADSLDELDENFELEFLEELLELDDDLSLCGFDD
jgi:hypothetical protein